MAVFLPALLLCRDWKMSAEISQKQMGNAFYELTSEQTELKSCYYDEPEYANPIYERLKKDWEKSSSSWRLEENREVIDLGKTAFIPDFVLVAPDREKIYLDVLGFWTPKTLQKRLEEFQAANYKKYILAAWQELRGSREEPLWENENVVFFKTKLDPRILEEAAENLSVER
jgi:predicted nuclease of restriction endonuclease-like RecB superfamily